MSDSVERLPPEQIQILTLNQIKLAAEKTALALGEPAQGDIFSYTDTVTPTGFQKQNGKDLYPKDKTWKSLSFFNNGPDIIIVELLTWANIVDKITKRPKRAKVWQDEVTLRVNFELKLDYPDERIVAIRATAKTSTATVDVNLAR